MMLERASASINITTTLKLSKGETNSENTQEAPEKNKKKKQSKKGPLKRIHPKTRRKGEKGGENMSKNQRGRVHMKGKILAASVRKRCRK